jgi:hypothetical protein
MHEADLIHRQDEFVLLDTVGAVLERNSTRRETKALDENGQRCTRTTTGPLTSEPTHATRTDPDQDAWRYTILPTHRLLDPDALTCGRPSRQQRADLARHAGHLASAALRQRSMNPEHSVDPDLACYLYLQSGTRTSSLRLRLRS